MQNISSPSDKKNNPQETQFNEAKRRLRQLREKLEKENQEKLISDTTSNKFRIQYLERERELEESFALKESQLADREKFLQKQTAELDAKRLDHERKLEVHRANIKSDWKIIEDERKSNDDKLRMRLNEVANERKQETEDFAKAVAEIAAEREKFEKDFQKKIEITSQNFISTALKQLRFKEISYQALSIFWNILGASALAIGLVYFIYITYNTTNTIPENLTWEFVTFSTLKGFVSITLLIGFTRYAYLLSSTYLKESSKNADRRHAINYGKFYLESYGAISDWAQIKEVFENWNINNSSETPSNKSDDLDLVSIEKVTTIIERIAKIIPNISSDVNKK